jgi:hypothetical protein
MQWFGGRTDEDPKEFWRKTAEKRGGQIGFLTYAMLVGRSGAGALELSGLLYTVNETVWFEDFERSNWLSRLIGSRTKFEQTEISFGTAEVRSVRLVARNDAARCIAGKMPAEKVPEITFLGRLFSTPIAAVTLVDGATLFFDVMRLREFQKLFASPTP